MPQRGSSIAELRAAFPFVTGDAWDLTALGDEAKWREDKPGEWVHPQPVEERLGPFMASLRSRPEARVAVMGHSGVMERMFGTFPGNCEVLEKEV